MAARATLAVTVSCVANPSDRVSGVAVAGVVAGVVAAAAARLATPPATTLVANVAIAIVPAEVIANETTAPPRHVWLGSPLRP